MRRGTIEWLLLWAGERLGFLPSAQAAAYRLGARMYLLGLGHVPAVLFSERPVRVLWLASRERSEWRTYQENSRWWVLGEWKRRGRPDLAAHTCWEDETKESFISDWDPTADLPAPGRTACVWSTEDAVLNLAQSAPPLLLAPAGAAVVLRKQQIGHGYSWALEAEGGGGL